MYGGEKFVGKIREKRNKMFAVRCHVYLPSLLVSESLQIYHLCQMNINSENSALTYHVFKIALSAFRP